MDKSSSLLIVWHSRTGASEQMANAAARGAGKRAIVKRAKDAVPADFKNARGYLFVCPENLGTMSGLMKDMFDQTYYPLLGQIEGRAFATIIAAGSDGRGATSQIDRIATGWRLKRCTDPLIINFDAQDADAILADKLVNPSDLTKCYELGEGISEALALGVY